MKKEEVGVLAQLISSLRDSVESLEIAIRRKDNEDLILSKREIVKTCQEIKKNLEHD